MSNTVKKLANYTEVIITVVSTETVSCDIAAHHASGHTYPTTRVFRMEFECLDDALNYIDTSNEPRGLIDVQEMGK